MKNSHLLVTAAWLIGCSSHSTAPAAQTPAGKQDLATARALPAEWPNHGSQDCVDHKNSDAPIYELQYDENTWILRENKCLNFEANFIYLLFGKDKVLLQDTGSIPEDFTTGDRASDRASARAQFSAAFPLRDTVEKIIAGWLAAHPNADGSARGRESIELLVTHSHSHGDHVSGDYQFLDRSGQPLPHTQLVGLRPRDVATFFGISSWPLDASVVDLGGGRVLDVLPIPGHEAAHIALYDRVDQLLLTGDSLYPGHLFIQDWTQYRASMSRLDAFTQATDVSGNLAHPVVYVLGNHIEKPPAAGQFYDYPSWLQEPERKLELATSHLDELNAALDDLGPVRPGRELEHDDFAIDGR